VGQEILTFPGLASAHAVVVQPDGKIVVAGSFVSNGNADFAVARLLSNGTPDSNFGNAGLTVIPFDYGGNNEDVANAVVLQPDGKIVVAGYARARNLEGSDYDFAVARLLPNGLLDPDFDGDGKTTIVFDRGGGKNDVARAVALQPDGKIVVAGSA